VIKKIFGHKSQKRLSLCDVSNIDFAIVDHHNQDQFCQLAEISAAKHKGGRKSFEQPENLRQNFWQFLQKKGRTF
jgi:hypothetical protein